MKLARSGMLCGAAGSDRDSVARLANGGVGVADCVSLGEKRLGQRGTGVIFVPVLEVVW